MSSTTQKVIALTISVFLCFLPCISAAQNLFEPGELRDVSKLGWSGIIYGVDTDSSLKKKFRTSRGAVIPEGIRLDLVDRPGERVDVLFNGRGKSAKVVAVRYEATKGFGNLQQLSEDLDCTPENWFPKLRTEEWNLVAFPKAGVLFVRIGFADPTIALFMPPEMLSAISGTYQIDPSLLAHPFDPGADWDGRSNFRINNLSIKLDDSRPERFNSSWRRRLEEGIDDVLQDYDNRILRHSVRSSGTVDVTVTGRKFNSNESGEFVVSVNGNFPTPYGMVSVSRSLNITIRRNHSRTIVSSVEQLIQELDGDFQKAIRKFGPEPISIARHRELTNLYKILAGVK